MISIHSDEENQFIRDYVENQTFSETRVWIGLKRKSHGLDEWFEWIDKSPLDYFNWYYNTREKDGDYVEMWIYNNGKWHNVIDQNLAFVCGFDCKLSIKNFKISNFFIIYSQL